MGIDAGLIVASLDLQLVRLLRGAIRAADIAGGKFGPCGPCGVLDPCIDRRPVLEPELRILPRRHIHPTPKYERRPIIHPTPRLAPEPPPPVIEPSPEPPPRTVSPIQPPWKQLIWNTPIPPRPILKVVRYKTDIPHKGSLLDVFI